MIGKVGLTKVGIRWLSVARNRMKNVDVGDTFRQWVIWLYTEIVITETANTVQGIRSSTNSVNSTRRCFP